MAAVTSNPVQNHILTGGGFKKLPLIAENENKQKVRLYYLDSSDNTVIKTAKAALAHKVQKDHCDYKNDLKTFKTDIKQSPYLLKEGKTIRLLSSQEAIQLQLKYGVIGSKAEKESGDVLKLLKQKDIKTDEQFIKFYNESSPEIQTDLLPLINTLFCTFQEKTVLTTEEVKTLTLLGQYHHEGIQRGALNLLIALFEQTSFISQDYGFGLKYLLDQIPADFFKKHQLLLLSIFDKLISQLDHLLETGKSVNHEIEPLMASLTSVARALLNSELKTLDKSTKDSFYKKLKTFYSNERYSKRFEQLSTHTNYLLIHHSLWTIQHLIRIVSSEHKAVTTLRKIGHGLLALKTLVGAPLKAGVKLIHEGELPDKTIIPELEEAYKHGKEAFGIKDIPRPWYEMLEKTEIVLLDPQLTEEQLEALDQAIGQYDAIHEHFNKHFLNLLKKQIGQDQVTEETKEFAFGFVGQLSHIAMDHPEISMRQKAVEILEKMFGKKDQSRDVCLFILTTLQNIIDTKHSVMAQLAKALQAKLHQQKPELAQAHIFRQSKYPCLVLIPGNSQLLDEAKGKLQSVSAGSQPFPMSKFIYGYRDIRIFEKKVTIEEDFAPKAPAPISPEELQRAIQGAEKLHIMALDRNGRVTIVTRIGHVTKTVFKEEVKMKNFTG